MKKFLILLFIFGIVLIGCSDTKKPSAVKPSSDGLVLAIGGEPEAGFDPTTGWGRYGSPLFQSTLLTFDKDLNIINDLATDHQVSEDGLKWTVTIREDVLFSDGEPLTASDVVFTFDTAQSSASIIDLHNLVNVEETDSSTIVFTLKQPESTFIYSLVEIGIVPKHAYDDAYSDHPIGSGPFNLVQWDKGQQLIVEENSSYYGEKSNFKQITFLFLSEDSAFAAAKAGDVDVVAVTPAFAKKEVDGMKLVKLPTVDNRGIMFPYVEAGETRPDDSPIGNDVTADEAIRHAINLAIDREGLVDSVLEGFGSPAYSVADYLPWWNKDTIIEDANFSEAERMLDDAGWKMNENDIREKDGLEASFTLIYPADDYVRQSLSMVIAEMVKPLGIEITPSGKGWNEIGELMYSTPVMMGWGSHDPLEMYNIYSSKLQGEGEHNANYYHNPIVDDYMEQALRATSEAEANELWQKAQWDGETGFSTKGDAPWAWLVNLEHLYFVKDNLDIGEQKIQPHGHGWPITDYISSWQFTD